MKAEVGDLIVWSAQSRWSPMQFGIVYRMDGHIPWVQSMPCSDVDCSHRKQQASTNYLVIAQRGSAFPADPGIREAFDWWLENQKV